MIRKALSEGYKAVKSNFWTILGMAIPALFVAFIPSAMRLSSTVKQLSASMMQGASAPQGSLGLYIIIVLIASVFIESFRLGLLQSDKDKKFEFKKTFVGFKNYTWVGILVIAFLMGLIFTAFLTVFSLMTIGFCFAGATQFNDWMYVIAAIIAIVGVILYVYVALGLKYVFFAYYTDTLDDDNSVYKAFSKSWKLMKGNKWQLLGLVIIEAIIKLVSFIIIALLIAIVYFVISAIFEIGLKIAFGILLGFIVLVISLIIVISISLWLNMVNIKFFEELK